MESLHSPHLNHRLLRRCLEDIPIQVRIHRYRGSCHLLRGHKLLRQFRRHRRCRRRRRSLPRHQSSVRLMVHRDPRCMIHLRRSPHHRSRWLGSSVWCLLRAKRSYLRKHRPLCTVRMHLVLQADIAFINAAVTVIIKPVADLDHVA